MTCERGWSVRAARSGWRTRACFAPREACGKSESSQSLWQPWVQHLVRRQPVGAATAGGHGCCSPSCVELAGVRADTRAGRRARGRGLALAATGASARRLPVLERPGRAASARGAAIGRVSARAHRQVNLLGRPEARFRLLVHLPDCRMPDREEDEALLILLQDGLRGVGGVDLVGWHGCCCV